MTAWSMSYACISQIRLLQWQHTWFPSSSWRCQCPCGCDSVVKIYIHTQRTHRQHFAKMGFRPFQHLHFSSNLVSVGQWICCRSKFQFVLGYWNSTNLYRFRIKVYDCWVDLTDISITTSLSLMVVFQTVWVFWRSTAHQCFFCWKWNKFVLEHCDPTKCSFMY